MIVVERGNRLLIGSAARIVGENDQLQAWAEKHVRRDPDIRWILGNFVEADHPNSNGHIFPLKDLESYSVATIPNKPLNMLHRAHRNVGTFAAGEMLYPTGAEAANNPRPIVEALAAFWRGVFPEEGLAIERAHQEGALFYSMECVPESLTCAHDGCNETYPFQGIQHDSYCAHLNASRVAPKVLNHAHFNGGALILPPVRPGWSNADITELEMAGLIEANLGDAEDAEHLYDAIAAEFSHLDPRDWELMMATVLSFDAIIPDGRK